MIVITIINFHDRLNGALVLNRDLKSINKGLLNQVERVLKNPVRCFYNLFSFYPTEHKYMYLILNVTGYFFFSFLIIFPKNTPHLVRRVPMST